MSKITRKDWLPVALFVVLLVGVFSVAYRNLVPWQMVGNGDLVPWFPNIGAAYQSLASAWSPVFLGKSSPTSPGEFLAQASLIFLTGGNATAAQGIFFLSLLPLSAITMYILVRHITRSHLSRILVSSLYAVNGLTIPWFMGGGYLLLPFQVFFPLLMLYLIKILEAKDGRIVNMLIFALLLGFIASFQRYMYMLFFFMPFIIVFSIVEMAYRKSSRYAISTVLILIGSFAIMLPLLAPILVDVVSNTSNIVGGYTPSYLINGVVSNYSGITSIYNVQMFNLLTLTLVPFVFFSLLIHKSKNRMLYLSFLLVSALILLLVRLLITNQMIQLFYDLPIMFAIKSPERLAFIVSWAIFPMMAILVDEVQRRTHFRTNSFRVRAAISVALCGLVIAASFFGIISNLDSPYNNPSNNLSTFFSQGWVNPNSQDVGYIKPSLFEACKWIDTHRESEGFFRTLWIPSTPLAVSKFLLRYDPLILTSTAKSPTDPDPMLLALMPLIQGETKDVGKLLNPFNVKYVVVSLENYSGEYLQSWYSGSPQLLWDTTRAGWYPAGDPTEYAALLNSQNDLRLVAENPGFLIYENLDFVPSSHVSIYNKMFFVAPTGILNSTIPTVCPNLIQNPNFENGFSSWSISNNTGAAYFIDNTTSYSGQSSLRMEMYNASSDAVAYQSVDIEGDRSYYISALAKTNNTNTLEFHIYFFNSTGEVIDLNGSNYILVRSQSGEQWSEVGSLVDSPPDAVKMEIDIETGFEWSITDKAKPAIAWVDDVTLALAPAIESPVTNWGPPDIFPAENLSFTGSRGEFPYQSLHGQMLIQVPNLLSHVPYLNSDYHLLVYGDFTQSSLENQYLSLSDAVIFLGDLDSSALSENWALPRTLLFVYEAESSLFPLQGKQTLIEGSSYSYGYALKVSGGWAGVKNFFAPRNGYYNIMINVQTKGNYSLNVNGQPLTFMAENGGDNGFKWLESTHVYLEKGYSSLSIGFQGNSDVLDQIMIFSTTNEETAFKDVFSSMQPTIIETQKSPSEYNVDINSTGPSFIVLGESFNSGWTAVITTNGETLEHLPANNFGWANGFYLSQSGDNKVNIIFEAQTQRNIAMTIWGIGWVSLVVAISYFMVGKTIKSRFKCIHFKLKK